MCKEDLCLHNGAEGSVYKKNNKLFGFVTDKDRDKLRYKNDNSIDPNVGFYINRIKYSKQDLQNLSTDKLLVVGDGSGEAYGNRSYLTCLCLICNTYGTYQLVQVIRGNTPCYSCFNTRLSSEAKENGLLLLGESTDGSTARRNYEFIECGHTRNIATGDVRVGHFSCIECFEKSISDVCKTKGLILVGSVGNKRIVQFNDCKHVREIYLLHLQKDTSTKCQECSDKSLQEMVKINGISVKEIVPGAKRKIVFDKCGHDKVVGLSNLKNNTVSCGVCHEIRIENEAKLSGLKFVKKVSRKKYLYITPCGCELINCPAHVRKGHWKCRNCEKSHYDFPSKLYLYHIIFKDGMELVKLGYARNPKSRLLDYKLSCSDSYSSLIEVDYTKGIDAFRAERVIHKKYKLKVLDKSFVKNYLTESGFTECYPISMKDILLEELRRLDGT